MLIKLNEIIVDIHFRVCNGMVSNDTILCRHGYFRIRQAYLLIDICRDKQRRRRRMRRKRKRKSRYFLRHQLRAAACNTKDRRRPAKVCWPGNEATTNHGRPLAARNLWLAQRASQIFIASPEGLQKFADLEMNPQLSSLLQSQEWGLTQRGIFELVMAKDYN